MLKGIPSIISPELLKILMEMGHGDEIVIADGNLEVLFGIDAGQADCSRIAEGVRNGVFDNRLKRQLGNQRIGIC